MPKLITFYVGLAIAVHSRFVRAEDTASGADASLQAELQQTGDTFNAAQRALKLATAECLGNL